MPDGHPSVAQQGLLPIPPLRTQRKQLVGDQPGPQVAAQVLSAGDLHDAPLTQCALEHGGHVVAARGLLLGRPHAAGARPLSVHVDVVGPVDHVHETPAPGAACDLPQDGFARSGAKPLHVHDTGLHAQGRNDLVAQGDPAFQRRLVRVPVCKLGGADPLLVARDERRRKVLADAVDDGSAIDAERVPGQLLAPDELLHTDLGDIDELVQAQGELLLTVDPPRGGGASAGDRLDHQRKAQRLGSIHGLAPGGGPPAARHPAAPRLGPVLHELLVSKAQHGVAGHAPQTHGVANPPRQEHQRLPQSFDPIDAFAAQGRLEGPCAGLLVGVARQANVGEQSTPGVRWQRLDRHVAGADDGRANLRQAAREALHLLREARRQENDLHGLARAPLEVLHERDECIDRVLPHRVVQTGPNPAHRTMALEPDQASGRGLGHEASLQVHRGKPPRDVHPATAVDLGMGTPEVTAIQLGVQRFRLLAVARLHGGDATLLLHPDQHALESEDPEGVRGVEHALLVHRDGVAEHAGDAALALAIGLAGQGDGPR